MRLADGDGLQGFDVPGHRTCHLDRSAVLAKTTGVFAALLNAFGPSELSP